MVSVSDRKAGDPSSPADDFFGRVVKEGKVRTLRVYPPMFMGGEVKVQEPEGQPNARTWLVRVGPDVEPSDRIALALWFVLERHFGVRFDD